MDESFVIAGISIASDTTLSSADRYQSMVSSEAAADSWKGSKFSKGGSDPGNPLANSIFKVLLDVILVTAGAMKAVAAACP